MTLSRVLRRLYRGPVTFAPAVANPYRDECPDLDRPGAARVRRRNLEAYLETVGPPRVLLLGEAMGYRGARFSGIAFTSERQLAGPDPVRLAWSRGRCAATSLLPRLWTEPSGTIVWRALGGVPNGVLLWNAFPWHPHRPGPRGRGQPDPRLANRTPEPALVRDHFSLLQAVLDWAQPETVGAVGRIAATALGELGAPHVPLRHPARGGARLFAAQVGELLSDG